MTRIDSDDCEHPDTLRRALQRQRELQRQVDDLKESMGDTSSPHERRKHGGLTDEQVEVIKQQLLSSIYEDIGRSIIKKVLWAFGAMFLALLAWLEYGSHVNFK